MHKATQKILIFLKNLYDSLGCFLEHKKKKLPLLQLQLRDKNLAHIITFAVQEKSIHRCCPNCKKETLITFFTFNSRDPPKDYKKIIKNKLLKYEH
jgi:hypothetical protein